MVEVLVEHDYIAKESDELTIKKGDIIKDVVKKQDGWWIGVLNDKKGLFPDNFVKVLTPDSQVVMRSKTDVSRIRQCRVIYSYSQDHEDELNLNVGDIITIIGEEEEGWWKGTLNGKEGVFPSNFVEEIKPVNVAHSNSKDNLILSNKDWEDDGKPSNSSAKQLCLVKYSYTAQNEDELTLTEGDKVTILSKNLEDPGWWRGELNGKVGVFPDNFVEIIAEDNAKQSAVVRPMNMPVTTASHRKSTEIKNDTSKSPPVPSKKPFISIKKSPSGSLLSDLKKKLVDVVDGASSSKSKNDVHAETKEFNNNNNDAFDQVERKQLLTDVRATRAKAPGRRPPSTILKPTDLDLNGIPYGDETEPEETTDNQESVEIRPKIREWEKHKAPWLNEMKQLQVKRTSTSPGPDRKLRVSAAVEKETLNIDAKDDVSKSKPHVENRASLEKPVAADTSAKNPAPVPTAKPKPTPSPVDSEKAPPLKQKPTIPVTGRQLQQNNSKDIPPKPKVSPVTPILTPERPLADSETVTPKEYNRLLDRVRKLEMLVEKQHHMHTLVIEEMQNKLDLEIELRMLLQEKVEKMSLSVMQV